MIDNKNVDTRYFVWLCGMVGLGAEEDPPPIMVEVAKKLYSIQFYWDEKIVRDENRSEDAKELRVIFSSDQRPVYVGDEFYNAPANVLEVFVSLAERCFFQTGKSRADWFLRFVYNLGIMSVVHTSMPSHFEEYIELAVDRWMSRKYEPDGSGGLFPLQHALEDQRQIEIWYQMSAYIIEEMEAIGFLSSD